MKILLAKTAGFCMGVRRAVELVLDAPEKYPQPIFTYGPLIHNPQVLELLAEKGITVLSQIPQQGGGTVLIRAHGVPPEIKKQLTAAGFKVIDATCPRVIKVQTIIKKHVREGCAAVIVGDQDHPEVVGLLGFAGQNGYVVASLEDLNALPAFEKAIIVAQTTQNIALFEKVKAWAAQVRPHYKIFDTICDSTGRRQAEVREMAKQVEAMVVVGGHNSGNTQRLAEIAEKNGKPTFHIETDAELPLQDLAAFQRIGLTAGASTPHWIIRRVFKALESTSYSRSQGLRCYAFNLQRALLLTNIYVALGAGALCYTCTRLQGISTYFPHLLISVFYVQSMHILNNLTGIKSDRYNDPDRAAFYQDHRLFLTLLALISGGTGLTAAILMGWVPFLVLLMMSLTGLSYKLTLVPKHFMGFRYRRIRDIPGSKTLLITLAWGVVTSLFPALSPDGRFGLVTVVVFLWSLGMVFVRTAFFDILDMQGDRIVGKGTLPLLLGEKRTLKMLNIVLIANIVLPLAAGAIGIMPAVAFPLALIPVSMGMVIHAHANGRMLPGLRLEFLMESHFILAGVIAFAVSWIH